jgi:hypothetical protein
MADAAQRLANEARTQYPRATNSFVLQQFNKTFGRFTYGTYVSEGVLGFIDSPQSGSSGPPGRSMNRGALVGTSGFSGQFLDSLNGREDQVHHFGVYFSGGIAGGWGNSRALDYHRRGDVRDQNWGDVNLGDRARDLGTYLRNNPGQLNQVGQLIRNSICNGNPVPK